MWFFKFPAFVAASLACFYFVVFVLIVNKSAGLFCVWGCFMWTPWHVPVCPCVCARVCVCVCVCVRPRGDRKLLLPALWTPSGRSAAPAPPAWRCPGSASWRSSSPARWAAPGWSESGAASVSGSAARTGSGCCSAAAAASPALCRRPAPGWILRRCWCHRPGASWPLPRRPGPGPAPRSVPGRVLLRRADTWEPPCGPGAPPRHPSSLHRQAQLVRFGQKTVLLQEERRDMLETCGYFTGSREEEWTAEALF